MSFRSPGHWGWTLSPMGVPGLLGLPERCFKGVFIPRFPVNPKNMENDSKWYPKMSPKVIQIDMDGPFETYGIYGVGATFGHLGRGRKLNFFLYVFSAPTW